MVKNFIDSLSNIKGNFTSLKYEGEFDCRIKTIAKLQRDGNRAALCELWDKFIKQDYFELEHPFYQNTICRAVASGHDGLTINYIFMIDINNLHPFIIVQQTHLINCIIYENKILILSDPWNTYLGLCSGAFRVFSPIIDSLIYKEAKWCFLLRQYRPAHYFFDLCSSYLQISTRDNKELLIGGYSYFVPNYNIAIKDNNRVCLYPTTTFDINPKEFEIIYKQSLESLESLVICDSTPYDLTLWLGLPGERRAWLEQVEGCAKILKILSKTFKKIRVFIDGMTAYDYQRLEFAENKKLFNNVLEATRAEFAGSGFKIVDIDLEKTPIDVDTSNALSTNQAQCKSQSKIAATFCQPSTTCHTEPLGEVSIKNNNTESQKAESQNLPFKLDSEFELNLNKPCVIAFKSLSGYDYRSKICYGSMCEFAIGDSGTTLLTPFQFCKIPGVVFYGDTSAGYVSYSKNAAKKVGGVAVDERYILQVNRQGPMNWDFHIPFEHIYNLSAEVLEGLSVEGRIKSGVKLERLEVPSVEIVAKQYEIKERFGITLNYSEIPLFLALEASFKSEIEAIKVQNVESQNVDLQVWANRCGDARHENSTNFLAMTDGAMACKSRNDGVSSQTAIPQLRGAKARVQNHLAYKLGVALIVCSKSFLGYLQMPFVLSYIKKQHKVESLKYKDKIAKNPHLKLSKLEDYVDYKDAIKEKECLTYKLGEALIWADRNWYKGGYVWLYFETKRLRGQFKR
ncbi:MAG: hypothetical protein PUB96_05255 [Helicobacteraceae bacterium]|nr:hypothetical protein [Helicobacteraceae bacterium]